MRSNISFAWTHQDVNSALIGAGGPATINRELAIAHINLFWTPVSFVDLAIEGGWGERKTLNGLKGTMYTTEGMLRVRF